MHQKFKELQEKYPQLGGVIIFTKLIKGKKMTEEQVEPLFDLLVDKSDWKGTPRKELIGWLSKFSNGKS